MVVEVDQDMADNSVSFSSGLQEWETEQRRQQVRKLSPQSQVPALDLEELEILVDQSYKQSRLLLQGRKPHLRLRRQRRKRYKRQAVERIYTRLRHKDKGFDKEGSDILRRHRFRWGANRGLDEDARCSQF